MLDFPRLPHTHTHAHTNTDTRTNRAHTNCTSCPVRQMPTHVHTPMHTHTRPLHTARPALLGHVLPHSFTPTRTPTHTPTHTTHTHRAHTNCTSCPVRQMPTHAHTRTHAHPRTHTHTHTHAHTRTRSPHSLHVLLSGAHAAGSEAAEAAGVVSRPVHPASQRLVDTVTLALAADQVVCDRESARSEDPGKPGQTGLDPDEPGAPGPPSAAGRG